MVLYISTGYPVLGIAFLDQLKGARDTHISYHDTMCHPAGDEICQAICIGTVKVNRMNRQFLFEC